MSLTPSSMVPLGTDATDFQLPDGQGKHYSMRELVGSKGLLVVFMSNHCPFVIHLADALARLGRDTSDRQIGMVAINANDVDAYPQDSPENMVKESKARGYVFPYLFDGTQQVAKDYDATCTPDFFLYDRDLKLVYRGQFDDSRPGNDIKVTGKDLYSAIDNLITGKDISDQQKPSVGCNIKWR